MVVVYRYDPWGRPVWLSGSMSDTLGALNPFRYRGYVYDTESGLYYLRSRYYNPNWGRFISADSILGQTGELLHHNTFAYCNNNPVILKDNNGFFALLATIGFMAVGGIIGLVINMSISILTQAATGENINWKSVGVSAASGFIGGAVAASPLGLKGQFVVGATLGALSYVADSNVNGEIITTEGVVTNALIGGFSGLIGGPGANYGMAMTDASTYVIKTVVRYSGRANQRYAAKAISRSVQYSSNIIIGNTWEAIIRYTTGGVFASAAVPYTEDVVHLLLN